MTYLGKHPAFNDELLPENKDLFQPKFLRDTKGTYFMQLPGYGKWKVSVEPGSKIISQGSETESGNPATNPDSIMTGSLHANTVISVGDNIYLDAGTGCIFVGDYIKQIGSWMAICGDGMKGYNGQKMTFAYFLQQDGDFAQGDVFIGDYTSDEYILWDDSEGKLYIKGDLILQGDLQSANYVAGSTGWKLTYLTGEAEFQDVWVRGRINMEPGSTGSADYITETISRRWAAETGADVTGSHTSNNTNNVSFSTALDAATGAQRGLNAINAFYRYGTWLNSDEMTTMGGEPDPGNTCVRMDSGGIYGWRTAAATPPGESRRTFWLDATTGDLMLRGEIYASAGAIGGWIIDATRIWKEVNLGGNYTKVEMSSNSTGGAWPHFQVFTDTNSGYSSPTGIQMTVGNPSVPVPRIDIYKDGIKRVMLSGGQPSGIGSHEPGLYWFDTSGNVTSRITSGNSDGDVTFGGGVVRLFANGVRVSYQQPFSAADGLGRYFQFYCDSSIYGRAGVISAPTSDYIKVSSDGGNAIAWFNGNGLDDSTNPWALDLLGNLGLFTNASDRGTKLGALYFNTGSNKVRVRTSTGWRDVGGSTLPGGGDYQMLRFDLSVLEWVNTSNVYIGANSGYNIVRDGGGDMYFNVPAGIDYAFRIGGSFKFTINNNIWCSGELFLGPTSNLNIRWTGSQCYINRDTYVAGSIRCSGSVEMSTGRVRVGGTDFYPTTGAFNPAKSYLRSA